jgi:hypothetical protein
MSQTTARIIRQSEARNFMEGPEHCREYVKTARLWFGTSSLQAGERGAIDPGHANSGEVFFVCQGHVRLYDEKQYYELHERFEPQAANRAVDDEAYRTSVQLYDALCPLFERG